MGSRIAFGEADIPHTNKDYQDALAAIQGNDPAQIDVRKLGVLVDDVLLGEIDHVAFGIDLQSMYDRVVDYVDADRRGALNSAVGRCLNACRIAQVLHDDARMQDRDVIVIAFCDRRPRDREIELVLKRVGAKLSPSSLQYLALAIARNPE